MRIFAVQPLFRGSILLLYSRMILPMQISRHKTLWPSWNGSRGLNFASLQNVGTSTVKDFAHLFFISNWFIQGWQKDVGHGDETYLNSFWVDILSLFQSGDTLDNAHPQLVYAVANTQKILNCVRLKSITFQWLYT